MSTGDNDDVALRGLIGRIESTFGSDLEAWLACFARPVVFVTPTATLTFADDASAAAQFRSMPRSPDGAPTVRYSNACAVRLLPI
jgi:hypothetical protein